MTSVRSLPADRLHAPAKLVERDGDLARVIQFLSEPPGLLLVTGEAGIGKSRLLEESCNDARIRGCQRLAGHAHPSREPFPLGPWLEALAQVDLRSCGQLSPVAGALRRWLPERAGELPEEPPPIGDAHAERHRLARAVLSVVAAIGPAVLVLEDFHWADSFSIELLSLLAAHPAEQLVVAVTCRDQAVQRSDLREVMGRWSTRNYGELSLGALSPGGTASLASEFLGGGGISRALAKALVQRTGGIPFLVLEDLRSLRASRCISQLDGEWHLSGSLTNNVPTGVADTIRSRALQLTAPARHVLELLAVTGAPVQDSLVRGVTGWTNSATADALSEVLSCRLAVETRSGVEVCHALARDAIYWGLGGPTRKWLHKAVAEHLVAQAGDAAAGQIAYHYSRAGDLAGWGRWAEVAAENASALGDDRTAFEYLSDLLSETALPERRRPGLAAKLGWALPTAERSEIARTRSHLEDAARRGGLTSRQAAELLMLRGWVHRLAPESAADGYRLLSTAARQLDDQPEAQARVLATLATAFDNGSTAERRQEFLRAASAAARRTGDPVTKAHVSVNRAWLLMASGDPDVWRALGELPAVGDDPALNRQLLRGLVNTGNCALDLGHYDFAEQAAARALRLSEEMGLDRYTSDLRRAALRVRWLRGHLAHLDADLASLADDESIQPLDVDVISAERSLARGRLRDACVLLERVVTRQLQWGGLGRASLAGGLLVRALCANGDTSAADDVAVRVLGAIEHAGNWPRAGFLMPYVPVDRARRVLNAFRAGIDGADAPLAQAALSYVEGKLLEPDDGRAAATRFATAAEAYARIGDARLRVLAAEAHARTLGRLKNSACEDAYRAVWHQLSALDFRWEADRVAQEAREVGVQTPRRGGRRSRESELSPRERQVADLAAAGRTNREIAGRLFLSRRTVDSHMASILRKLQLPSRRELAGHEFAASRGAEAERQ